MASASITYETGKVGEPRIVRAKGVRFNYLQFLWSRINAVHGVAESGDFSLALKLLILDIPILPPDIKEMFEQRAKIIEQNINKILNYQIPHLQHIKDLFIKQMLREKYLQYYCKEHYVAFIKDLFDALKDKGLIEQADYEVLTGESHTLKIGEEDQDLLDLMDVKPKKKEG